MTNKITKTASIKIRVSETEYEQIQMNAQATGLSVSAYLRQLGTGYEPKSLLDHQHILSLMKVNADLARLGSLLKQKAEFAPLEFAQFRQELKLLQETIKTKVRLLG